jgi:hypothetical protein
VAPVIVLVLDALAVFRLTRLVTEDVLLTDAREDVIRWAYRQRVSRGRGLPDMTCGAEGAPDAWAMGMRMDPDPPKLATLVTCRWCAGMWISLAVVAARRLFPRAWPPLAKALAFSAGAALLAGLED